MLSFGCSCACYVQLTYNHHYFGQIFINCYSHNLNYYSYNGFHLHILSFKVDHEAAVDLFMCNVLIGK